MRNNKSSLYGLIDDPEEHLSEKYEETKARDVPGDKTYVAADMKVFEYTETEEGYYLSDIKVLEGPGKKAEDSLLNLLTSNRNSSINGP